MALNANLLLQRESENAHKFILTEKKTIGPKTLYTLLDNIS